MALRIFSLFLSLVLCGCASIKLIRKPGAVTGKERTQIVRTDNYAYQGLPFKVVEPSADIDQLCTKNDSWQFVRVRENPRNLIPFAGNVISVDYACQP